MTAAEQEVVDTYKVAQVVVVAGEEERRGIENNLGGYIIGLNGVIRSPICTSP